MRKVVFVGGRKRETNIDTECSSVNKMKRRKKNSMRTKNDEMKTIIWQYYAKANTHQSNAFEPKISIFRPIDGHAHTHMRALARLVCTIVLLSLTLHISNSRCLLAK